VLGLGSLTLRLVAGATVWIAAALLAGGLILSALFKDRVEQSFDERLGVLLETLVAVTDSGPAGTVRLLGPQGEPRFDQPFSGWYWQINGGAKPVLRSRSLWDQVLELPVAASARPGAEGSAIRRYRIPGPRGQMLQVVERNITARLVAGDPRDGVNHRSGDPGVVRAQAAQAPPPIPRPRARGRCRQD
jgi:hypothetical protein